MDRRTVLKGASGIAAASTLSGCLGIFGGNDGPQGDAMLWHALSESETAVFESSVEMYNDENDAEIVYEETGDLRNRVETTLAGSDGPEMYRWAQDWAGGHWERDFLYDASDDVDIDLEGTFSPGAVDAITLTDGQLIGLPVAGETTSLFYNRDMVDSPPETWAEMESIMQQNYDPGNGQFGISSPVDTYFLSAWLHAFDGYVMQVNDDGEAETGLRLEETKRGMEFFRDNVWKYMTSDVSYDPQVSVFANGNAPFAINGPWEVGGLVEGGIDVGVTSLPPLEEAGGEPVPFTGTSLWYFSARMGEDEDRRDSALGFAEWISTDEQRQIDMAEELSQIPVLQSINPEDLEGRVSGFLEDYNNGIPMPNHAGMSGVWTPTNDALTSILTDDANVSDSFDAAADSIEENWE